MAKSQRKQDAPHPARTFGSRHPRPASGEREKRSAGKDEGKTPIDFDPHSETLDADYSAFQKRAKQMPPAERVATQAKFDAAFARRREQGNRKVCEFFRYWMICADKACGRKQACAGHATKCFERHWPVTPHHMRLWLVTASKAMSDGMSAEDASRAGDAEVARWNAHVARLEAEARAEKEEARGEEAEAADASKSEPLQASAERQTPRVRVL